MKQVHPMRFITKASEREHLLKIKQNNKKGENLLQQQEEEWSKPNAIKIMQAFEWSHVIHCKIVAHT